LTVYAHLLKGGSASVINLTTKNSAH